MATKTLRGGGKAGPAAGAHGALGQICPHFHKTIELVGKRWTGAIVQLLMDGPQRFTALRGAIPGLHDRLLSERLKELEAEGMVTRRVYAETPVHIEYSLTDKGRDLEKVFTELHRWADRWIAAAVNGARGGSAAPLSRARK
jgi:DNA-binding HxlR family transcriptional regulator